MLMPLSAPEWWGWLKGLPFVLQLFVLLILSRPILDNFHHVKHFDPLLSPANIAGAMTPLLALLVFFSRGPRWTATDRLFYLWAGACVLSSAFIMVYDGLRLGPVEVVLRMMAPFFIYFLARRLVRSRRDFDAVCTTFLYSCGIVLAIFAYEIIGGPIRVEMSRGLTRIQGNFGDVLNYSFYAVFGAVLLTYRFFRLGGRGSSLRRWGVMGIGLGLTTVVLLSIAHTTSYLIFLAVVGLFLFHSSRRGPFETGSFVAVGALVVILFMPAAVNERVMPLVDREVRVYQAEGTDRLLHGRVGRWKYLISDFGGLPTVGQVLGRPAALLNPYYYTGSGAHNDFLRILLFTGFVGLGAYAAFLVGVLANTLRRRDLADRQLGLATLAAFVLYSVTTTPTLYAPVLYFFFPIVAFLLSREPEELSPASWTRPWQ